MEYAVSTALRDHARSAVREIDCVQCESGEGAVVSGMLVVGWMSVLGCSGGASQEPALVALVDAESWAPLAEADDPYQDWEEGYSCSALGYGVEDSYFEVDTGLCEYATFSQPLLHDVAEGDDIELVFWYLDLWSEDELAEAHILIAIGESSLVDERIPIPSDADVRPVTLPAPRAMEAGEPVYFHLHNHGYNSWSLGSIEAWTVP